MCFIWLSTSSLMPLHRRSNDMRHLLVIKEAAKRMQAEAVDQDLGLSTAESARLEGLTAQVRGAEVGSQKPGWMARTAIRRTPSDATTLSPPKPNIATQTAVATRVSAPLKIARTSVAQTASGWERLRQLLESTRPATWVFSGD